MQRSLSGGYLTEDAALLNANARGKSDEALATTPSAPDESPRRRRAALRSHKRGARSEEAGCELWEVAQTRTARLRTVQVLVVASAGNSAEDPCSVRYDPISTPDKLLVGSTTQGGSLSGFSNYGACVHVQVPPLPRPM